MRVSAILNRSLVREIPCRLRSFNYTICNYHQYQDFLFLISMYESKRVCSFSNSGRLYRGHVSNSLGYQLIDAVYNLNYNKQRQGGSVGGLKMTIWSNIFFTWYFIDFSAVMYLFEVKESALKSFVKIGPSMLKKMAVLCKIKARGRFRCHAHILIYFYVFLMPGIRKPR